jgi:O-antigen/teichoic acid export membrane protein
LIEQPIGIVFQTLMLAVFPAVTAAYEIDGRHPAEVLVGRLTRVYLLLALPAAALLGVLAQPVMHVMTQREEFRSAYTVAPRLAAASMMYGLHYYAALGLHLARRTGQLLALTALSIGVNLIGNWWLVPVHGYDACGMVRLLSNGVLVAAVATCAHRHLRWSFPWASLIRIGLASTAAGGTTFLLQRHLPPNLLTLVMLGCVFGIVYATFSLITRELRLQDLLSLLPRHGKTP